MFFRSDTEDSSALRRPVLSQSQLGVHDHLHTLCRMSG